MTTPEPEGGESVSNKMQVAIEELQAHFAKGQNLRLKRSRAQEHLRTIRSELMDARDKQDTPPGPPRPEPGDDNAYWEEVS